MCNRDKHCCQKPEYLKGKAQDCPQERIRKCHGSENGHLCTDSDSKGKDSNS